MPPTEMLNVPQAAAYLGCSVKQVYLLTSSGKLAHYRPGTGRGSIRFIQSDLDTFVAKSRIAATDEKKPEPSVPYVPRGPLKHVQPRAPRSSKRKGG